MRAAASVAAAAAVLAATSSASAAATSPLAAKGTLYAFAITDVPNDDTDLAAVMVIDPATGSSKLGHTFAFSATDQSSLYCFIGWDSGTLSGHAPTYFATSGPTPNIDTVDVRTGALVSSVPMKPSSFVMTFSYDETRKTGVAVLGNYTSNAVFLAEVDTATGGLTVVNASFPYGAFAIPCTQRLIPSHGWGVLLQTDTSRDDAPEEWVVFDYANGGAVVFTAPWSLKQGRVNAFSELPLSAGALAVGGMLATPKDDAAVFGSLVWLNFTAKPGDAVATTLVDFNKVFAANVSSLTEVTMTLGCLAVAEEVPGSAYTAHIVARDMGTDTPLLISVPLVVTPAGGIAVGGGAPRLTLLDETGINGDVYGLRWTPAAPAA